MKISINKTIPFIKYRRVFIGISLAFILASLASIYFIGFNYGIDFKGGIKLIAKFGAPTTDGSIKDALAEKGFSDTTVQRLGVKEDDRFTIKVGRVTESTEEDIANLANALKEKFTELGVTIEQQEAVGPKVGQELKRKGNLAILFSLIAMLVYISVRFNFIYAPGAILSLVHDVIITLGVLTFLHVEFNLTILAAILTIVGYSINDTIVIFDRIRENSARISNSTIYEVVNECVNVTLSRTIITSLTVLFVVVILFFFGGGVIHDFALTFIVGVITGSYSTIFVASPIYIFMYKRWPKFAVKIGLRKEA